jgi:group I intron endonuclease
MTCGIYAISFCGRNRIYIGQSKHIQRRWEEHTTDLENDRHANVKMKSLWRKFGNTMRFHVIKECSIERLNKEEQLLIDVLFHSYKEQVINIQRTVCNPPDQTGRKRSEATIALMKIRQQNEEVKAKKIAALKGRKHSEEVRVKISAALKGKKRSEEAKAKISASHKGKSKSEETKAKISAALKGKKRTLSEEHRAKLSAANKARAKKEKDPVA